MCHSFRRGTMQMYQIREANSGGKSKKVVVYNNEIPNPIAVRYAWTDVTDYANLYNLEGLPASPFRISF